MKPGRHELTEIDLDTIYKALSEVDLLPFVAEVVWLCEKLGLPDPPWFVEDGVREHVDQYRTTP